MVGMEVENDGFHVERIHSSYTCKNDMFEFKKQRYQGQQYSNIYFARLLRFRDILINLARNRWPESPVCTVLDLEDGKECVIIGTLYKEMKLKPSILDEYSKERTVKPLVEKHNFMHPSDFLYLEDESGRVKLGGNGISPSAFVTGVVVALLGKEDSSGDFLVQSILDAGLSPQRPLHSDLTTDKYVALVSGIMVGSDKSDPLCLQLLVDHLTGRSGLEKEQIMVSQIAHVIIAGNSVDIKQSLISGQPLGSKEQTRLTEPIKELDLFLSQLAAAIPVDIMPGSNDPANFSWPQQPLHKCLFPGASRYNTFVSATNPHQFEIDGVCFLGTSGQNIADMAKYSEATEPLDCMERTLKWRHLAPTAPDTLGCYPFSDKDPFVIENCPHVYFCGNQEKFASRLVKGPDGQSVRLVCLPSFCKTGLAVMVNLNNLECHLLLFSTSSLID